MKSIGSIVGSIIGRTVFFFFCLFLFYSSSSSGVFVVDAWKQCSIEDGGGVCPDGNTCCPTGTEGISSCVPSRKHDKGPGRCCDPDGAQGCAYGYECSRSRSQTEKEEGKGGTCKLLEPNVDPKDLNAPVTPRYHLCRVSSLSEEALTMHGFPIQRITPEDAAATEATKEQDYYYNATYYSNIGRITIDIDDDDDDDDGTDDDLFSSNNNNNKFDEIETVLYIVHGSLRNADDYLCSGLSLIDMEVEKRKSKEGEEEEEEEKEKIRNKFLVLAPKFLSGTDVGIDFDDNNNVNVDNPLYWAETGPVEHSGHTWRYGAEALNEINHETKKERTGISSFDVTDKLLEHIVLGTKKKKKKKANSSDDDDDAVEYLFPKLRNIFLLGHSAGGQYVHRWSVLSNSPVMSMMTMDGNGGDDGDGSNGRRRNVGIRTIAANPRTYCYMDNRRMVLRKEEEEEEEQKQQQQQQRNLLRRALMNDNNPIFDVQKKNKGTDDDDIIDNDYVFDVPDQHDVDSCPSYNEWGWGFDDGNESGYVRSPYRDRVFNNNTTTKEDIAIRYGTKRDVYYLIGGNDTIDLNYDGCQSYNHNFQGYTRNERGHHYWSALKQYFDNEKYVYDYDDDDQQQKKKARSSSSLIHQFREVPFSPHDHTIMFQSKEAREAIFGVDDDDDDDIDNDDAYDNNDRNGSNNIVTEMGSSSSFVSSSSFLNVLVELLRVWIIIPVVSFVAILLLKLDVIHFIARRIIMTLIWTKKNNDDDGVYDVDDSSDLSSSYSSADEHKDNTKKRGADHHHLAIIDDHWNDDDDDDYVEIVIE